MIYTASICVLTWLASFLLWLFNVDGQTGTHAPPEYEAAKILVLYFLVNAIFDLWAYWLISRMRIRWHTMPLRKILLASTLLHVVGGVSYTLGLNYESFYETGLMVILVAQILAFFGPWFHKRFNFHQRLRRHLRDAPGSSYTAHDWPNRS